MSGLQGVKVIDLTQYGIAPACTRIMGELGAHVIKIEPFSGDEQRTQGLAWGMKFKTEFDDVAFDHGSFNKDWVAIDLKTEDGHNIMMKLLETADIFVTSLRDGALERLGLDYETLHSKFPRLVWGQSRGYGEYGPMKNAKGFDATSYGARSGFANSIPQANKYFEPGNPPIAFGDWNTALALTAAVMVAYSSALKTGIGDKATTSLYHVGTWGMSSAIIAQQQGCNYPKNRMNAKCPTNNLYISSDGIWFLMCFGNYNKYCKLVFDVIGVDTKYYTDPKYNTLEALAETGNNTEVVEQIHQACKKYTFAELEERFRENDIPFEKIQTIKDVLQDEEAYANDQLRRIVYEDQGYGPNSEYVVTTSPIRLKSIGDPVLYRSKPIGYDTKRILKSYGYSDSEIEYFIAKRAVLQYEGDPMPNIALQPSFGPHSKEPSTNEQSLFKLLANFTVGFKNQQPD